MKPESKQDILDILTMPEEAFYRDVTPAALAESERAFGKRLYVTAMLGYSNICRNNCLYCGMRAGNTAVKRFRLPPEEVIRLCLGAADQGYGRVFLISGEDPKYGLDGLLKIVEALKTRGMTVSLACGEFGKAEFRALADAGADEYVLKFEMSDPVSFNRLNPSTTFEKRMKAIETIRELGLKLASGNIVDWPGQTREELAEDILLMRKLEISWAPVIPYLPAMNTPLAESGRRGELSTLYREIAALRLMMPGVHITAQQPGKDMKKGLADPEGNEAAIRAGADVLFFDLLQESEARHFRVIDDRHISGPAHIAEALRRTGRRADTGKERIG